MLSLGPQDKLAQDAALVLANSLKQQGNAARAAQILEGMLTIQEQRYKPDHARIWKTRFALATNYRELGRFSQAAELFQEVGSHRKKVLGGEHPHTVNVRYELGTILQEMGRYKDAAPILEKVVTSRTHGLGPLHLETLKARNAYNVSLGLGDNLEPAINNLEKLLHDYETLNRTNGREAQSVRNNLGNFLIAANRPIEALAHLQQCLTIKEETLKAGHAKILITKCTIGEAYLAIGDFEQAKDAFRDAYYQCNPKKQQLKAVFGGYYGLALMRQGFYQESEENLMASFRVLELDSADRKIVGCFLWNLYEHWGKLEKGEKFAAFRDADCR